MIGYKYLLIFLAMTLLGTACSNETDTEKTAGEQQDKEETVPQKETASNNNTNYIDPAVFARANATISPIDKATFAAAADHEKKQVIAEKFCQESKGYQSNVWEGLNDCSWAIEKYYIEQHSEWAAREGDELKLLTRNGNYVVLKHDLSNPLLAKYYQFQNYYEIPDYFVVEVYQKSKCMASRMISTETGKSFMIKGKLFFSKDQSVFLASTFNKTSPMQCPNKIDFYAFANGQLTKKWYIPTGNWGLTDVRFISNNEFLIEQSTTDFPGEIRYARIAMQ